MNILTKVADLMATDLVTVTVHTPILEVRGLLITHGVHHLPVVGPTGNLEGIVSLSDFVKVLEKDLAGLTARDIMTSGLAKVDASETVRTAASLFTLNKFHALPVVNGDKLVGIITTLDLIKLIDKEEIRLEDYS